MIDAPQLGAKVVIATQRWHRPPNHIAEMEFSVMVVAVKGFDPDRKAFYVEVTEQSSVGRKLSYPDVNDHCWVKPGMGKLNWVLADMMTPLEKDNREAVYT
jgi:hypothetical protein